MHGRREACARPATSPHLSGSPRPHLPELIDMTKPELEDYDLPVVAACLAQGQCSSE